MNNLVVVSHDTIVYEEVFLAPGVVLSSLCRVGANTFLGGGCIVSNEVSIGKNAIVGVGSVVTSTLKGGKHYMGNPIAEVKQIQLT